MTCQCHQPGFCPILGREMPTRLHFLCHTRDDYRRLFQQQAGLVEEDDTPGCGACERGERERNLNNNKDRET